jgi:hypothetical protein
VAVAECVPVTAVAAACGVGGNCNAALPEDLLLTDDIINSDADRVLRECSSWHRHMFPGSHMP